MSDTISTRIKLRYDISTNWTTYNPKLEAGEMGIESDTGKIKIGDGSTYWTSLSYLPYLTLADLPTYDGSVV